MSDRHLRLADLVLSLKSELRMLGRWSARPPSPEALASEMPFSCDRLPFEGWLQFVFVPRMAALIEHAAPLPTECAMRPLANQCFAEEGERAAALLRVVSELDQLLSAPGGD